MGDEEKEEMAEGTAPPPPPPKKKFPLVLLIAVLAIGAGMGVGGWFIGKAMTSKQPGPTPEQNETLEEVAEDVAHGASHGGGHGEKKEEKKDDGHGGGHGGGHGEAAGEAEESGRDAVSFKLGPVATNLNDSNIRRVVSVTLVLKARDAEAKQLIDDSAYELQNECVMVLSSKTLDSLRSMEGKQLLLEELQARFEHVVGKGTIERVLYENIGFY